MTDQELKNILELHRKWVMGEDGGSRADLSSANLRSADLRSADLSSADLRSANLSYADLRSANLRFANLRSADLSSADLGYADLSCANLRSANLRSADLSYADLRSANLSYADLSSANLRSADLSSIKEDFFIVLEKAKTEVLALYDALMLGKINGSQYQGECACLVGTIANARHEKFRTLGIDLRPEAERPAERWFLAINEGDLPQNNPVSKITAEWMREFMEQEKLEYPEYRIVAVARENA